MINILYYIILFLSIGKEEVFLQKCQKCTLTHATYRNKIFNNKIYKNINKRCVFYKTHLNVVISIYTQYLKKYLYNFAFNTFSQLNYNKIKIKVKFS